MSPWVFVAIVGWVLFALMVVTNSLHYKDASKVRAELVDWQTKAQQWHAACVAGDKAHKALQEQHSRVVDRARKVSHRLRGLNALQRKNLGVEND